MVKTHLLLILRKGHAWSSKLASQPSPDDKTSRLQRRPKLGGSMLGQPHGRDALDRNDAYFVLGDGRPLLYLHAAGGPQFTPFLEGLAQTHRVFCTDRSGFEGTAQHPGIETVPQLAGLAAEFAQKVIGQACDIIGHSFGGWVALWLALSHPDCVDHLVLERRRDCALARHRRRAARMSFGASFMPILTRPRPSTSHRKSRAPTRTPLRGIKPAPWLMRRCSHVCPSSRRER